MKLSILIVAIALLWGCYTRQPAKAPEVQASTPVAGTNVLVALPLDRGFYVARETPCENASNATLTLHTANGLNGARAHCQFTRIEKTGDNTYSATEECHHLRGGVDSRELEFKIDDRTSYSVVEVGFEQTFSSRYCPQESLPEPWRSNDLSDILQ